MYGSRVHHIELPPDNDIGNFCKHPKQEPSILHFKQLEEQMPRADKYKTKRNR